MNNTNGHRPLIISTGISLMAIISMSFYLGAKTQTLESVTKNQDQVIMKLDNITTEQAERDLWITRLDARMEDMHESIMDIQNTLKEGKRR